MASGNDREKMIGLKMISNLSHQIEEKLSVEENLSVSAVQSCLQSITTNMTKFHCEFIFDEIVPYLFTSSSDMSNLAEVPIDLSSDKALLMITVLVTFNTSKFLKFASRSILSYILSIPSGKSITQPTLNLISTITMQLIGDDVEVTSNASKSIVALCKQSPGLFPTLFVPPISDIWKQAKENEKEMKQNSRGQSKNINKLSTICVRCATTIIEVSILSNQGMGVFETSGASSLFLEMLQDPSDPLVQISSMDLLEKMARILANAGTSLVSTLDPVIHNNGAESINFSSQRNRCAWLFSSPVLNFLLCAAGAKHDGDAQNVIEADVFIGGQALKIISVLCPLSQYDSEFSSSIGSDEALIQQFQRALYNFDYTQNESYHITFIDAISSFSASSTEALDTILNDDILMERWLSLSISKPKLKAIVLLSVARILDPSSFLPNLSTSIEPQRVHHQHLESDSSQSGSRHSSQSCVRLYQRIGQVNNGMNYFDVDATTEVVLSQAKSPIPELRIASYMLLKGLVKSGKILGARLLLNNAGCFEFLVNRDLETTKEGKEAKYEIIEALMKVDGIQSMLEDRVVSTFGMILKQGPHYVKPRRWDQDLM